MRLSHLPFLFILALSAHSWGTAVDWQTQLLGHPVNVETLHSGLNAPWGFTLMNDQQLLISEKSGTLVHLDLEQSLATRHRLPLDLNSQGQGGFLDVALAPDFAADGWVYLTYSQAKGRESATALARFRWHDEQPDSWQTLWSSDSWRNSGQHFGSRIAFDDLGHVFFTVGDRGDRSQSQDKYNAIGSVLRLTLEGEVPADNPFLERGYPALWSIGHRNPQGIFFDSNSSSLWVNEHGPRGGDEINLIQAGRNYGWPLVTHGREYWGPRIGSTSAPNMVDPLFHWTPSIAPSSLLIYRGAAFPSWQGLFISSSLAGKHLNFVDLTQRPGVEHRLLAELDERLRAVRQDSQGRLLIITDSGKLLRLSPPSN